jgi:outer membrane lipoprotein-sorting protein
LWPPDLQTCYEEIIMCRAVRLIAVLTAFTFIAASAADAQTLEELIAKNLEAKGGLETLKATSTVKMTGRFKTEGVEMPMTTWAKRPNQWRREADVPPPPTMAPRPGEKPQRQKMVTASDGTTAWTMMGSMAPQTLSGPQAEAMKKNAEFESLFVDYKEKGYTIALVGKETLQGKPVYHLKVTRKDAPGQDFYLDGETGLETRIVIDDVDPGGGAVHVETELSDYRKVQGRMVPFRTRQSMRQPDGTRTAEMSLETIEFNLPLEDSMFRLPSGK